MKKQTPKRNLAPSKMLDKPTVEAGSRALVDEQPQLPLVEKETKPEECRHDSDDVNHRFGKSAGST
jgi:hypothetical protein